MINADTSAAVARSATRGHRTVLGRGLLLATLLATAGAAHAQAVIATSGGPDQSLTMFGITLYGIVDVGLTYESRGAPISDYFPAMTNDLIQKNSRQSIFTLNSNNLSQSRVGLKGIEPLGNGFSAVFRLETFFNPTSGNLSDGLKSLTLNNGRPLDQQSVGIDTSVAGQAFAGAAYLGVSHAQFGTLTFGRQLNLIADGVNKYDPMGASQAFSVVGLSGTAAGGGDTEDRRFDNSAKYLGQWGPVRFGALYQFNGHSGGVGNAYNFDLGFDYAGFSVDGYYLKKNQAIATVALSAAQVADLQNPALPTYVPGYTVSNSLSATISDNTVYAIMAMYSWQYWKFFGAYEHIQYANPSNLVSAGTDTIGGYVLAFVNNAAFPDDKILEVYWAGAKWSITPTFDLTAAIYGYHQNAYATGADAGCSTNMHGSCSGTLAAYSLAADWHFTKRFDAYAGAMWSGVKDGLANGYISTTTIDPTIGVRFSF
jgi:predicted porin